MGGSVCIVRRALSTQLEEHACRLRLTRLRGCFAVVLMGGRGRADVRRLCLCFCVRACVQAQAEIDWALEWAVDQLYTSVTKLLYPGAWMMSGSLARCGGCRAVLS